MPLFLLDLSPAELSSSPSSHSSYIDDGAPTLHLIAYSVNQKGRSEPTVLEDIAINEAERRTGTCAVGLLYYTVIIITIIIIIYSSSVVNIHGTLCKKGLLPRCSTTNKTQTESTLFCILYIYLRLFAIHGQSRCWIFLCYCQTEVIVAPTGSKNIYVYIQSTSLFKHYLSSSSTFFMHTNPRAASHSKSTSKRESERERERKRNGEGKEQLRIAVCFEDCFLFSSPMAPSRSTLLHQVTCALV